MPRKRPIYSDTYQRRRLLLRVGAVVVVLLLVIGGAFWWFHRNPRPSATKYPVMGVAVDQTDGYQDSDALTSGGRRLFT